MCLKLQIRIYQPSDESALVALWHNCGLVVPQNDPKRDIKAKIHFQPDLLYVGILKDQIIASVMIGYEGHRGWINYLAVDPNYQNQGIGQKMIKKAESVLRSLRCLKINLQVRSNNKAVIRFYENLGYTVEDIISMGKRL